MNLLNEIIAALSSQNGSLTDALLKTKVLQHTLGHKELLEWVNNELNGYPDGSNLPEYRILLAQVLANVSNGAYQALSHPIPIGHLSQEQRETIETAKMNQPLAVLERLAEKPDRQLRSAINMEANILLDHGLANGFRIQKAWSEIENANIAQILVQVRSRLLDFVLGLKDQIGDNESEQEIKKLSNSFDVKNLFNQAVFGDNTTIVVGAHNKQHVSNIAIKGDLSALAEELCNHGIKKEDISKLELAINADAETPEIIENKFGPSVKAWLKDMFSKAVDSSWQIELGVAGSLLASALQKYYGWP